MAVLHSKSSLLAFLKDKGIETQTTDHPKVLTVEEQAKYVGHLPGGHSKNLLLKDKKSRLILISSLTTTEIDMKVLSQRLGLGKGGVRLAPEDIMQAVLKVPLGCVTPFALVNESARSVTLLLDEGFRTKPKLYFHPLSNDATTAITPGGLDEFLCSIGRKPAYVNLEEVVAVGKDQPPDLAGYLVDATPGSDNSVEQTPVPSKELSEVAITRVNSKGKPKDEPARVKESRASSAVDIRTVKTRILELVVALNAEIIASPNLNSEDSKSLASKVVNGRLVPELEDILTGLKNTAYTEGFVAGLASRSLPR